MEIYLWSLGAVTIIITIYSIVLMPERAWRRAALIGSMITMLFGLGWVMSDLLARPKSTDLEWVRNSVKDAKILAYRITIDRAIFFWLLLPGDDAPGYYVAPWDRELAKELEQASRKAGERGLYLNLPFQKSWEKSEKKRVYPAPQPMLPPKLGSPPIIIPREEES